MSTRQFLPRALRQCLVQGRQQHQLPQQRAISTTTSKEAGLRQTGGANTNFSQQLSQLGANDNNAGAVADPNKTLQGILADSNQRHRAYKESKSGKAVANALADLRGQADEANYVKMMPRNWEPGQIYAPHDLGAGEARKWSDRGQYKSRKADGIAAVGINPLDNYRNFTFISEHITSYGRILKSDQTGFSPRNQRKMAKTIRRAIGLGLHPSVHFHPELLKMQPRGRELPMIMTKKTTKKTTA
ncbi:hypothetical protein V8F20_000565 [Naviculisporaceae sp. PSN 640]